MAHETSSTSILTAVAKRRWAMAGKGARTPSLQPDGIDHLVESIPVLWDIFSGRDHHEIQQLVARAQDGDHVVGFFAAGWAIVGQLRQQCCPSVYFRLNRRTCRLHSGVALLELIQELSGCLIQVTSTLRLEYIGDHSICQVSADEAAVRSNRGVRSLDRRFPIIWMSQPDSICIEFKSASRGR